MMQIIAYFLAFLTCQVSSNASLFSLYRGKTTLQLISSDPQFSVFYNLIRHNSEARNKFVEEELTVFVPTNEALSNYQGSLYSDTGLYHMALTSKDLWEIRKINNLTSVNRNLPKLWISTKNDKKIYVNNAKVVAQSVFSTSKSVEGKILTQNLFMIDQLLDPLIYSAPRPHTAYDFLTNPKRWSLDQVETISLFKSKVQQTKLETLWSDDGGNTYFIPIDKGISPQKYSDLNNYAIKGHIVPNLVFFTRPTIKYAYYETMANDADVYMVVSFVEIDKKMYVKSRTVFGNDENPIDEYVAEIVSSDIPVANGVVHLISEPLGINKRELKPFPYMSVLERLGTDFQLSTFYDMGEVSGFNKLLSGKNKSYTLFVPNDFAWRQMRMQQLTYMESHIDLLKRHLIISDSSFSIERLYEMGRSVINKPVELQTAGGFMKVFIHKKQETNSGDVYYIQWYNKLIKVIRANYECSDGMIHVMAGPFASLQRMVLGSEEIL